MNDKITNNNGLSAFIVDDKANTVSGSRKRDRSISDVSSKLSQVSSKRSRRAVPTNSTITNESVIVAPPLPVCVPRSSSSSDEMNKTPVEHKVRHDHFSKKEGWTTEMCILKERIDNIKSFKDYIKKDYFDDTLEDLFAKYENVLRKQA